jgi:hypothetical protein
MKQSHRRARYAQRSAIGKARGLASQRVQRAKRATREIDADTLRLRALHDAKGQTERQGCDYSASGETHWQIRRSVAGSVRQRDLVLNGRCVRTGAKRTADRAVRWRVWAAKRQETVQPQAHSHASVYLRIA